jgi:hypothetical protein
VKEHADPAALADHGCRSHHGREDEGLNVDAYFLCVTVAPCRQADLFRDVASSSIRHGTTCKTFRLPTWAYIFELNLNAWPQNENGAIDGDERKGIYGRRSIEGAPSTRVLSSTYSAKANYMSCNLSAVFCFREDPLFYSLRSISFGLTHSDGLSLTIIFGTAFDFSFRKCAIELSGY